MGNAPYIRLKQVVGWHQLEVAILCTSNSLINAVQVVCDIVGLSTLY